MHDSMVDRVQLIHQWCAPSRLSTRCGIVGAAALSPDDAFVTLLVDDRAAFQKGFPSYTSVKNSPGCAEVRPGCSRGLLLFARKILPLCCGRQDLKLARLPSRATPLCARTFRLWFSCGRTRDWRNNMCHVCVVFYVVCAARHRSSFSR